MAQYGQSELHQEELQTVAGRQEHAGYCQKGIKCRSNAPFFSSQDLKDSVSPSVQAQCVLGCSGEST